MTLPGVPGPNQGVHAADKANMGTAIGWACNKVVALLTDAVAAYKMQVLKPLVAKQTAAGCVAVKSTNFVVPDMLVIRCDSYEGYQQCYGSPLGKPAASAPGVARCEIGSAAHKKLADKIIKSLGSKRCEMKMASYGNVYLISCTRPWKVEQCQTLLTAASPGLNAGQVQVQCQSKDQLKNEPAFSLAKKQAQDILNKLNGVKKVGSVQTQDGKTEGLVLVPPVKPCRHADPDPLSISCPGNPQAPAEMKVNLPACAPDPGMDGADAVCYAGPLTASKPVDAVVAAKPAAVASGPDLTAQAGAMLLRRGGSDKTQWGSSLTVSDKQALGTQDGKCHFGVHFVLANAGSAASGPFEFSLAAPGSAPAVRRSGPLAPGATGSHEIYVYLRPGANVVRLDVDSARQVPEGNENNNVLTLNVNVDGSCGGRAAGPAPGRQAPVR
jgi:hypothetical protein